MSARQASFMAGADNSGWVGFDDNGDLIRHRETWNALIFDSEREALEYGGMLAARAEYVGAP